MKSQKDKSLFLKEFVYLSVIYFCSYYFGLNPQTIGFVEIRDAVLGFSMLASMLFVLSKITWGKLILKILIFFSILCFVVDLFCFVNFDSNLSIPMYYALLETTLQESKEFLWLYLNSKTLESIAVFLLASLVFYKCNFSFVGKKIQMLFYCLVIFGGVNWAVEFHKLFLTNGHPFYTHQNLAYFEPLRMAMNFAYVIQTKEKSKEEFQKYTTSLNHTLEARLQKDHIQNIVLLLGESAQRGHMQLYGYSRPTSPHMQVLSATPNLLVYDDVISPHAQTSLSIPKIFSTTNYENESQRAWYQSTNLISLFKSVGYKTYWISNQEPSSYITPAGMLGSICDDTQFASIYKQLHDGSLLPYVSKILDTKNGEKRFITIHLIGAHNAYGDRYPHGFGIFDATSLDEKTHKRSLYDNAMLYNDLILDEVFKIFSQSDSIVIYLSDHGEEIYEIDDFIGHGDDRLTRFTCEIPMLVYVSDIFIQKHSQLYQRLKDSIHRPYMSDDLIYTVLDIAGIQTPDFDPTRSIINKSFNDQRKRMVGGSGGKDYDKELKKQKSSY